MSSLLKDFYAKVEGLKGKKLLYTIIILFLAFILIGVLVGYFMSPKLSDDEISEFNTESVSPSDHKEYYEGRVLYVNPEFHPFDNIDYSLVDSSGKEIILLKSADEKLSIAEGLFVRVSGKLSKLSDNKTNVLVVDEVLIKNATD